ncbi:MAG: hypothetical protein ACR2MO_08520 [Acidimicrobiales bacterium]
MGRRIEVELTSTKGDGTWTWRAVGAKQPKGVVDAALLYEGAQVGDVVRADADFEIEGILITAVLPPRGKKRSEPERLEIIGPPREHQGVTSSLVPKSERPRSPRGRDGDRDRGDRGPRPGGGRDFAGRGGPSRPLDDSAGRPGGRPPGADGRARPEGRTPRPEGGRPRPEGGRAPRTDAASASGEHRPERGPRPDRGPRPEGGRAPGRDRRRDAPPVEAAPKPKRLAPANIHRAAVVETLAPEQRPIAEQVLRGGIPAVRQAVDAQNARLREEGQPEVHAAALVAMAEQLLPQLKAAEWRDRAEAAAKVVDEVSLRDLRSVVSGADAARDDEGRILAGTLRQALERRVEEQREKWVADMTGSLDEGRLVRALRLSAHPPDPSTRFPAELAVRLGEAAGAAMTAEATPDRWATLLEAVADSPVRRTVKPAALPAEPGEPLLQAARQASGRVPALAALLGITMPPPPGPPRGGRPGRDTPSGGRRRPPPPPPPDPAAAVAPPLGDDGRAEPSPVADETPALLMESTAAPLADATPPTESTPLPGADDPEAATTEAAPAGAHDPEAATTEAAPPGAERSADDIAPAVSDEAPAPTSEAAPPADIEGPEPAAMVARDEDPCRILSAERSE